MSGERSSAEEKEFAPLADESIRAAVRTWREDREKALDQYGPIEKWNTSSVTNMNYLFSEYNEFDGDISAWDVSNVTDMTYMFKGAKSFSADISGWNVSSVTNMRGMFDGSTSFSGNISGWNSGVQYISDVAIILLYMTHII